MKRASGILLPVSSLPSPYGIGTFSKEAYEFVDKLKAAGQSYWQILPLGPTGYGDSPYQPFSTFAGNPYFIDLETLIKEGLLTKEECDAVQFYTHPNYIEYGIQYNERIPLLRKAYERSHIGQNPDFHQFLHTHGWWVEDYALYMAVKKCFGGAAWNTWAQDIRLRWDYSLDYYRSTYPEEIEFYEFMQYEFFKQWTKLKAYANANGIRIIGDLPIYVSYDSADAWANPQLFQFDDENYPVAVAGVPPDAFSATGQLWGNPLYRWDYQRSTGYAWWIQRMRHAYTLYDVIRIDHFRGFDEYFSVPYGAKTAEGGHWEKGPGMELFETMRRVLGEKDIIAEDLGVMTPSVERMVSASGYPNMHVLMFGFEPSDPLSTHMVFTYSRNSAVYTGTHDNETLMGWYKSLPEKRLKMLHSFLDNAIGRKDEINWDMIRLAMMSCSDTCIIPIQDYLGLGNEARMNQPSTLGTNWKWRMGKEDFTDALVKKIRKMTEDSYRYIPTAEEKAAK